MEELSIIGRSVNKVETAALPEINDVSGAHAQWPRRAPLQRHFRCVLSNERSPYRFLNN